MNNPVPPTKHSRSPLALLGVFPLAISLPRGKRGKKEKRNVFQHRNTDRIFRRRSRSPSNQEQHTFTVLSLATKASWKNKQSGEWESRTEWHRGIVFGPLPTSPPRSRKARTCRFKANCAAAKYEKPLEGKKKATIKQRIWEIHITSILKLDRTERVEETAPEQEQIEDPEVAP